MRITATATPVRPLRNEPDAPMLKAIFFDAADTIIYLPKSVGFHYALVGSRLGLSLNSDALNRAFGRAFRTMPARPATGLPREDDDKGWWRELVERVLEEVAPATHELDRDTFFEVAYEHFAEAGVWELFPDVIEVLEQLQPRFQLAVLSNFDSRLRMILEQLGVSKFFAHVLVSSELGADKPDPLIYRRALEITQLAPHEALHVGDDPTRDWEAAASAGFSVFRLDRPRNSLRDLLAAV